MPTPLRKPRFIRFPRHPERPREPRGPTLNYLRTLHRVWSDVQHVILTGLDPLLDIWPREGREDEAGVTLGAFGPALRRRVTDLSDADLRRLWPGLDPDDVRKYAPWATSREEVYRVAFPGGTRIRDGAEAVFDCEPRVRAAIEAERRMRPTRGAYRESDVVSQYREPGTFRIIRPVYRNGQIVTPPTPSALSFQAIERQMAWIRLEVGERLATGLGPVLAEAGAQGGLFASRELGRVLGLDLRASVPGLQPLINAWRETNVNLIESGILAPQASPRMRPNLLADVSRTIEEAHASGLRVEALAGQLAERYGVSDSRAELIARDQILKLNAQVTSHRQQVCGITHYRWSASRDEKVRPRHRELDGTVQAWDSPPEVAPGRFEHPGGDYQCRCVAVPIPPSDGGMFDYGL